ncbi:ABC-F family ATP-binding cassette domain-containing protein [candidate division WWE3 bacterium]|uniref:ABC-F family ATP-binding cassette domain-containing protein n=1 Tax=candidate division WWE3 bacterium TaxID=2053526 RepID=A0A955RW92_UNCKA|nr:ABC-F family ATP-binding cassette domain-containing protein [candidate division WWE3 bacterium]
MISANNITKEIPTGVLLKDISFTLGNKEKVGLIGQNGCGKTTLLKIILGVESYELGSIQIQNETVVHLPQLFSFPQDISVREYGLRLVGSEKQFYLFARNLSKLGLDEKHWDTTVNSLSSGQQMKVKVAELLLQEPTVLILDEPTNHLDIDGILWIEEFISVFDGIVIMVSHDRSFLDNTISHIFEIDEKQLHVFSGNYSDYLEQKEHWVEERRKAYARQEKKREQLEQLLENVRKIKGGKQRGKAVKAAKKRMEREVLRDEINSYSRDTLDEIEFGGETHTGKIMLKVAKLTHSFGDLSVFENTSFEIRGNTRVWLFGPNGAGKSTLLNIITHKIVPTSGQIEIGTGVRWGYFRQNQEELDLDLTMKEYLHDVLHLTQAQLYGFVKKYLFPKEYVHRKLGNLSPGQRARLVFGVFAEQELDLLILDEPTNHLDIWTKESIENSLKEYKGALLFVSHDRYFVEEVDVDRIVTIENKQIKEIW